MNPTLPQLPAGVHGREVVAPGRLGGTATWRAADALAGSHGRNAEEFIDRVRDVGVDPMAAMVSANSLGAEALGMSDQIGSIAPGLEADIIALVGACQGITTTGGAAGVCKSTTMAVVICIILIFSVKLPSGGASPPGGWTSTSMSCVGSP